MQIEGFIERAEKQFCAINSSRESTPSSSRSSSDIGDLLKRTVDRKSTS